MHCLCVTALAALAQTGDSVEIPLNGQVFTLPRGYTIELVAKPPLVERPVTMALDHEGRLYVGDSSGSNEPVGVHARLLWALAS